MRWGLIGLVVLLAGCGSTPTPVAGEGERGLASVEGGGVVDKIFDAHAHFDGENADSGPSQWMVEEYRQNKVAVTVVHATRKGTRTDVHSAGDLKVVLCGAVVPGKTGWREVEKGLKDGRYSCLKVYLGYVYRFANDPFYLPFYRLARKYDVPVVFHTGDTVDKKGKVKFADPLTIDEIAVDFPDVTFVLAHMGNPWFESAAEVVYKNDNVYVDTSALMIGDLSKADPQAIEALIVKPVQWFFHYVENPKKILFGSDWPLVKLAPYIEAMKKAIPKAHWKDVFYENAARVFKKGVATGALAKGTSRGNRVASP